MNTVPVSSEVAHVLWTNQDAFNGRAVSPRCAELLGGLSLDDVLPSESLIQKICQKIDVPRRVLVRPMTKPVEMLEHGPFYAITRKLGTRWSRDEDQFAWGIAREITAELYLDVIRGEDEATKKKPFRGLLYAPFVLVMLAPITLDRIPTIGVKIRYGKRALA